MHKPADHLATDESKERSFGNVTSLSFGCSTGYVSDNEFALIRQLIYDKAGIFLRGSKKMLVSNRLRKRLDHCGVDSYKKYFDLVTRKPEGKHEIHEFINALTTNETFFFRHPEHFAYLDQTILPQIMEERKKGLNRKIRIWCAACSSGEEPYSIAMLLHRHPLRYSGWDIDIVGTDINGNMIEKAKQGYYSPYALSRMPVEYLHGYFSFESKDNGYRLSESIRDRVHFFQANLLKPSTQGKFDIVFCRNVMIYFDAGSKNQVIQNLYDTLVQNGYLVVGYAESLLNNQQLFKYLVPTVYQRIR